jgi:hypothetical protein
MLAARRIVSTARWSAGSYALRGLLPTVVFLKRIRSVRKFVNKDAVEVCFFVLFYTLTELLPLLILLLQLRVSRTKHTISRSSSQISPSINSIELPSPIILDQLLD